MPEPTLVGGEIRTWREQGWVADDGPLMVFLENALAGIDGRVLVAGPVSPGVVERLSAEHEVTWLLRSYEEGVELASQGLPVVIGALDFFERHHGETFEAVVCVDGLERLLGPDSQDLTWWDRLAALRRCGNSDARFILGLPNTGSPLELLDRERPGLRRQDNEWVPVWADRSRPREARGIAMSLAEAFQTDHLQVLGYWPQPEESAALIPQALLARVAADSVPFALLENAAARWPRQLLASPSEFLSELALAGRLSDSPPRWIVDVAPNSPDHVPSASVTVDSTSFRLKPSQPGPERWQLTAAGISWLVNPTAPSIEHQLRRSLAVQEDARFRASIAAVHAEYLSSGTGSVPWLHLSYFDEDGRAVFPPTHRRPDLLPQERFAAALLKFFSREALSHIPGAVPPWADPWDRTEIVLRGLGYEPERAREKAVAAQPEPRAHAEEAVRDQLDEVRALRRQISDLEGHVFGLERVLKHRDGQLASLSSSLGNARDRERGLMLEIERLLEWYVDDPRARRVLSRSLRAARRAKRFAREIRSPM